LVETLFNSQLMW